MTGPLTSESSAVGGVHEGSSSPTAANVLNRSAHLRAPLHSVGLEDGSYGLQTIPASPPSPLCMGDDGNTHVGWNSVSLRACCRLVMSLHLNTRAARQNALAAASVAGVNTSAWQSAAARTRHPTPHPGRESVPHGEACSLRLVRNHAARVCSPALDQGLAG